MLIVQLSVLRKATAVASIIRLLNAEHCRCQRNSNGFVKKYFVVYVLLCTVLTLLQFHLVSTASQKSPKESCRNPESHYDVKI